MKKERNSIADDSVLGGTTDGPRRPPQPTDDPHTKENNPTNDLFTDLAVTKTKLKAAAHGPIEAKLSAPSLPT